MNTQIIQYNTHDYINKIAINFINFIAKLQLKKVIPKIVLTGGNNGIKLLEKVNQINPPLEWDKIEIFWGDERFLPNNHADRNDVQAFRALINNKPFNPKIIHTYPINAGKYLNNPSLAAQTYENKLLEIFPSKKAIKFDLHLLGMGADGHINSLFPHKQNILYSKPKILVELNSPKPPATRLTLSLPLINQSENIWFLVTGNDKKTAFLNATKKKENINNCPAAGATAVKNTIWFIDNSIL